MNAFESPSIDVSIIVPCRNEVDRIASCVTSILQQEAPAVDFEVLVADGMSDDGTREVLRGIHDSRLKIVDNPGLTVPTGLNAAIRVAHGHIIMRMDAHTEYAPDYLSQSLAVRRETGADNVGGPARTKATTYTQSVICAAYHSGFSVGGARFHNLEFEGYVDTVPYGCWEREVFQRIGFFDEELVRNQDDEFNLRLVRSGGRIWQSPRIKSWYSPRSSLRALWRQYLQYGYWKVRVIQKHKLPASWRHLVPAAFVLAMVVLPTLGFWWQPALVLWLAIVVLYGASSVTASLLAAGSQKCWKTLPLLPVVFALYHFSYGIGFLHGVWDFLIRRRQASNKYTALTRDPSPSQK